MSKCKRRKNRNKQVQLSNNQYRIPTIAVICPRNGQEAMIEEMVGGIARLKFVDADQSQPLIPSADAVFLLTSFIGHHWTEAAQKQFARNSIYLIPGGITGLVHRIRLKAAKIFLLNADSVQKNKRN